MGSESKYVVILGSLDTKGQEVEFLRRAVLAEGGTPLVVDTGVLGIPSIPADISRHQVSEATGTTLQAVVDAGDKARALVTMAQGAAAIVDGLLHGGRLGGVLSIGGSRGTALATQVMQTLPIGIPKLMVSTMATGHTPFGPYVGTKDVTMMPSVADILGLNAITRPILTNAAAAIVAMSRVGTPVHRAASCVLAATMLGATTTLVEQLRSLTLFDGNELIAFHATGTGGRAMEELIDQGQIDGVFDVSLSEIAGWLVDGPYSAGPDRLRAAARRGTPQVIVPGGLDFFIEGPPETVQRKYPGRVTMRHTPTITLVRTLPEELCEVARILAGRLAEAKGPVAAILPMRGFSWFSLPGQPLHDPAADLAFVETFKAEVPSRVRVVEIDAHANDPLVGRAAVQLMWEMLPTCAPIPAADVQE